MLGLTWVATAQVPTGPPNEVSSSTGLAINEPAVAALADGRFVLVRLQNQDGRVSMRYRLIGREGSVDLDTSIPEILTESLEVSVAADPSGGFWIAWQGDGVGFAHFDSHGVMISGPTFPFDPLLGVSFPHLAALEGGGLVLFATSFENTGGPGLPQPCYLIFDPSGQALGPEQFVPPELDDSLRARAAVGLRGGGFALAWNRMTPQGTALPGELQAFGRDGHPEGARIELSQPGETYGEIWGVLAMPDGDFTAIWSAVVDAPGYPPPNALSILLRRFGPDGTPKGGRTLVNPTAFGTSGPFGPGAGASADSAGRAAVVWIGTTGAGPRIFIRIVDSTGGFEADESMIGNDKPELGSPQVAISGFGGILSAWSEVDLTTLNGSVWSQVLLGLCTAEHSGLSLRGGRFVACAGWRSPQGAEGAANPAALTDESGSFWFFDEANLELLVKVLDGCAFNDHLWVFAAGLTNVDVSLAVIDTWSGKIWTSISPLGTTFAPIQDTTAFDSCSAMPPASSRTQETATASGREKETEPFRAGIAFATNASNPDPYLKSFSSPPQPAGECVPGDTVLCLDQGRFRVEATYDSGTGLSGSAPAIPLSDQSGSFWFFEGGNVELFAKLLDACSGFDRFWFFVTGLTNVEVHVTVTDTLTSSVRHYDNALHQAFQPVLDTAAFATCSQ